MVDPKTKQEVPQFSQEVILVLEKKKGAYVLTGNWLYQFGSSRECKKRELLLQRSRSKSRA